MKILITTDLYKPFINGVITSIDSLVTQLKLKGHEVKIITLAKSHHSYTINNVIYLGSIDLNRIYPGAKLKHLVKSKELKSIYDWCPDIIHSQCEFSTFAVAKKISKKLSIPIVHTYHTIYEDYTHYFFPNVRIGHYLASKFSSHILNQCDNIIAPTKKVENLLDSYEINTPISVIPTGINLDKFIESKDKSKIQEIKKTLKISKNNFVIGFVGRIAKEKNLDDLFKIFNEIEEKNITLMIVGDGPYKKELVEKSRLINKQIVFTSMVEPSEIHHYYKCFDLFMSCSSSETQGLTYIESLASSIPTLCKKDPCLDEVIINNKNGFQFENTKEAIDFFSKFHNDNKMQKQMAKEAKNSAIKEFSSSSFCDKVINLYNSSLYQIDEDLSSFANLLI